MAQLSITSYFKKDASKRKIDDEDGQPKRQKTQELPSDSTERIETETLSPNVNMGTTWFNALEPELKKDYFRKLSSFLDQERKNHTIYPPPHQVYTWTKTCKINEVKVVILGQDPYHGARQAHGLCFSVQVGE